VRVLDLLNQVERATMRGLYGTPIDRLTCGGLAEGPLVWLSICACVEDGGQDWDEDVVFRKMSGHGTGDWRSHQTCSVPTDDPWIVLSKVKVVAVSHSAGFPRKRANVWQ
jgi:hypothetical protein